MRRFRQKPSRSSHKSKYFPHMVHRFFDSLWSLLILYNFVFIPYTTFPACAVQATSSSYAVRILPLHAVTADQSNALLLLRWGGWYTADCRFVFCRLCTDRCRFSCDQMLLFQSRYIFFDSVSTESYRPANGFVTWMTLKGFPILAVHQVSVHRNLSGRESKTKDFIRQRKIVFNGSLLEYCL